MEKSTFMVGDAETKFPIPPDEDEIWETAFDPIACLHYAAEYEKLEESARACGLEELADQYEYVQNSYFNQYEYYESH